MTLSGQKSVKVLENDIKWSFFDLSGGMKAMWGGYTPKLYDGHFIEAHKQTIEEKFQGGVIFGDTH